jgi:hypothetical protein
MEGLSGGWEIGVVVGSILRRLLFGSSLLLLETVVNRERRQPTRREWEQITSRRPMLRWVLERRPANERSDVSEEDALRRTREEIAQLEAERVRLSTDVMEGRPGALEEDERLRQRIVELGHWLSEAEKEGRGRRGMNEGPRPPQPPPVPPDACGGGG